MTIIYLIIGFGFSIGMMGSLDVYNNEKQNRFSLSRFLNLIAYCLAWPFYFGIWLGNVSAQYENTEEDETQL